MVATPDAEGLPVAEEQPVTEAPFSLLNTRRHQMFPRLTAAEIDRMRRFATERHWEANEMLFEASRPAPGMLVLLRGAMRLTRRDRLGHSHLGVEHHRQAAFTTAVG